MSAVLPTRRRSWRRSLGRATTAGPWKEIGKRGRRRIVVFFTRNENRTRLPRDRRADFPNYARRAGRQKNAPASPHLRFLKSDSWKRTSRAFVRTTQAAIVQLSTAILFGLPIFLFTCYIPLRFIYLRFVSFVLLFAFIFS